MRTWENLEKKLNVNDGVVVFGHGFAVVLGFFVRRGFLVGLGVGLVRLFGLFGVGLVLGLLTFGVFLFGFLVVRRFDGGLLVETVRLYAGLRVGEGRFFVAGLRVVFGLDLGVVVFTVIGVVAVVEFDAKVELSNSFVVLLSTVVKTVAAVVRGGCDLTHPFFLKRWVFAFLLAQFNRPVGNS